MAATDDPLFGDNLSRPVRALPPLVYLAVMPPPACSSTSVPEHVRCDLKDINALVGHAASGSTHAVKVAAAAASACAVIEQNNSALNGRDWARTRCVENVSARSQDSCTDGLEETVACEALVDLVPITGEVAKRIPYVVSALSDEWRRPSNRYEEEAIGGIPSNAVVRVFLPPACSSVDLRAVIARLAAEVALGNIGEASSDSKGSATCACDGGSSGGCTRGGCADCASRTPTLTARWQLAPGADGLLGALRLVQVASMLQVEEFLPELASLVGQATATEEDFALLQQVCRQLQLPAALQEAAEALRPKPEPACLPNVEQVRGMIASALLTADGKVWRVVQKVIDRREGWPRTARENGECLVAFATGKYGSIRATPHTGFFWGSRDFLYLVCRYVRSRPEHFDAMVSAMFDSVYSMDPELPAEIIDAVFKELLSHEGLTFKQCEHIITKLMQRPDQLGYLFHEWSGVFPQLPASARRALCKGLLPTVGRCPHVALDFVLKELDSAPLLLEGQTIRRSGLSYALAALFRSHRSSARPPLRRDTPVTGGPELDTEDHLAWRFCCHRRSRPSAQMTLQGTTHGQQVEPLPFHEDVDDSEH